MPDDVGECVVCGGRETAVALDVPPRALQLMRHGQSVPWEDVCEPATIRFCEPDWQQVMKTVIDAQRNPLPQCNAAYAEYDDDSPTEIDQYDLEADMWSESRSVLAEADRRDNVLESTLVGARIVTWSLESLVESNP